MMENYLSQIMRPLPGPARCRCGMYLFRGSTAKWDKDPKAPYDCVGCRPRVPQHLLDD